MKKENKGITLIALVITIIVMLILVGVSISMAINGGLFNYAGKAAKDTQNAIDAENELSNGRIQVDGVWYDTIDDYVAGIVSSDQNGGTTPGEDEKGEIPKVGDYVNYTPSKGTYTVASGKYGSGYTSNQTFATYSSLKWRIWSINEQTGEIELISDKAANKLYLKDVNGYNHGVDILNDMCKALYSNEDGAEARSINVEDINSKTTYDYTEYTYTSGSFSMKYGDTKRLRSYGTNYMKYPNLYSQEKGYGTAGIFNNTITGLNASEGLNDGEVDTEGVTRYKTVTGYTDGNTEGTDPYITFTRYGYEPESYLNSKLGVNTAPTGLIDLGTYYWLASRVIDADSYGAYFTIRTLNSNGYIGYSGCLFYSHNNSNEASHAVRPIVSLGSSVQLTLDKENTTESETYWNIEF